MEKKLVNLNEETINTAELPFGISEFEVKCGRRVLLLEITKNANHTTFALSTKEGKSKYDGKGLGMVTLNTRDMIIDKDFVAELPNFAVLFEAFGKSANKMNIHQGDLLFYNIVK